MLTYPTLQILILESVFCYLTQIYDKHSTHMPQQQLYPPRNIKISFLLGHLALQRPRICQGEKIFLPFPSLPTSKTKKSTSCCFHQLATHDLPQEHLRGRKSQEESKQGNPTLSMLKYWGRGHAELGTMQSFHFFSVVSRGCRSDVLRAGTSLKMPVY